MGMRLSIGPHGSVFVGALVCRHAWVRVAGETEGVSPSQISGTFL